MSRSIHTTRRTLKELRRQDFSDREEKAAELRKTRQQLRRKYFLKRQVATERTTDIMPVADVDIEAIPIEVRDEGALVHHACSIEDIRAVLAALPAAAVDGISRIQLGLGKEYIDESRRREEDEADPFTGRRSFDIYPGVYGGVVLGVYFGTTALIQLHAYVFDPEQLPLPRAINELYLRLHSLATLVHEVAHHHDQTQRVRRGRWLSDRLENFESYAEKMEYMWTREVVLPYLERTYAPQVKELLDWVEHQGGLRLPLEFFVGDPRTTSRNGVTRMGGDGHSVFEGWVMELPSCPDLTASRLAFAWELHFADEYDSCLKAIEKILSTDPLNTEARACRADTLVHLQRLDQALEIASQLLIENAANNDAWRVLARIHVARREWTELLAVCERWASCLEAKGSLCDFFRAVALCGLGRDAELEAELNRFPPDFDPSESARRKRVESRRRLVYRHAGRTLKV